MCEFVRIKSSRAFAPVRSCSTSVRRVRVSSHQHSKSTSLRGWRSNTVKVRVLSSAPSLAHARSGATERLSHAARASDSRQREQVLSSAPNHSLATRAGSNLASSRQLSRTLTSVGRSRSISVGCRPVRRRARMKTEGVMAEHESNTSSSGRFEPSVRVGGRHAETPRSVQVSGSPSWLFRWNGA